MLFPIISVHFFACLSPGPNATVVIRQSLAHSYKQGFATVMGIFSAALLLVTGTVFGYTRLFRHHPRVQIVFSVLGGGYLIYLGVRHFIEDRREKKIEEPKPEKKKINFKQAYTSGLLTNLGNPKSYIYYGSVLAPLLPRTHLPLVHFETIAAICLTSVCAYGLLAFAFGNRLVRNISQVQRSLNKVSGVSFVAAGLYIILLGAKLAFAS